MGRAQRHMPRAVESDGGDGPAPCPCTPGPAPPEFPLPRAAFRSLSAAARPSTGPSLPPNGGTPEPVPTTANRASEAAAMEAKHGTARSPIHVHAARCVTRGCVRDQTRSSSPVPCLENEMGVSGRNGHFAIKIWVYSVYWRKQARSGFIGGQRFRHSSTQCFFFFLNYSSTQLAVAVNDLLSMLRSS